MPKNRISLGLDIEDAIREIEDLPDAVEDGASASIKQLAVLAEGAMKKEVPEGSGRDKHTRDTIDTKFRRGGLTANVGARKRTEDGDLLAEIIVEGTDAGSYDYSPGLMRWLGKQIEPWADAKLGDQNAAWAIAENIKQRGSQLTFPQPVVRDSVRMWRSQVDDIANEAVADELGDAL